MRNSGRPSWAAFSFRARPCRMLALPVDTALIQINARRVPRAHPGRVPDNPPLRAASRGAAFSLSALVVDLGQDGGGDRGRDERGDEQDAEVVELHRRSLRLPLAMAVTRARPRVQGRSGGTCPAVHEAGRQTLPVFVLVWSATQAEARKPPAGLSVTNSHRGRLQMPLQNL